MSTPEMTPAPSSRRKPRIAVLGEFSSGKSTLVNVLLGRACSPVKVTATQVPPIWYCGGDGSPVVVSRSGNATEITDAEIASVPVQGTDYVRVHRPAEILDRIELIDMPGSSDPNMSPDIWANLLPQADAIIWCTPATQAWRQSEAAIWDGVDPEVRDRSLLLVTRIDKVLTERDRARLLKRVRRETEGLFRDVFPVDLLAAQGDDPASSGMVAVRSALHELTGETAGTDAGPADAGVADGAPATVLRLEDHAQATSRPRTLVTPRRITAARRPRRTSGSGGTAL